MDYSSEDEAPPPSTRVLPAPRRPSGTTSRESSANLLSSLRARRERERREDSVRTVTPDSEGTRRSASEFDAASQPSPRDTNGGEKPSSRRQGLVFEDTFETGDAVLRTMPPIRRQSNSSTQEPNGDGPNSKIPLVRPRNRTMDGQRHPSAPVSMRRQRVGSTNALGNAREIERIEKISKDDLVLGAVVGGGHHMPQAPLAFRAAQAQRADSIRKKPPVSQKLVKKSNERSRSASPVPVSMSTDTLPLPILAENPNRVLKLMENLNGRMRGEVEYQTSGHGSWATGTFYINGKGMLMNESTESGSYHQIIVPDLRGCRVWPFTDENEVDIFDVTVANGMRLRLRPLDTSQYTYWLSALLSCQQNLSGPPSNNSMARPESRSLHRRPSFNTDKSFNIIKIGKVSLWDKATTPPPTPVSKRPLQPTPRRNQRSWKKVSCILQDNGEFKLMTEEIDTTLLATIQLSQLSRSAIQQLDKTVLNQEFTIAIFPQYTASATSLSILKPIYISLETRVLFEVWFVLLRAFTVPELYGSEELSADDQLGELDATESSFDDLFRIDKTLNVRVVEAKIKPSLPLPTLSANSRKSDGTHEKDRKKAEVDPSIADYFAEVVLDGEVRARTTTKVGTLKPFWREDCEFGDLPAFLPEVSIMLKKMSASKPPTSAANSKSSLVSLSEPASEVLCGIVQIRMDQLERGKDVETWWPILNEEEESIGEMLVKIRHDELVVLLQKDYQPLSDLLHKFNTGLTVHMSQLVPSKLRFLAETLLDVFQVSGQSAQWLVALVEDEVDGIGKETPVQRLRFSRRTESNESMGGTAEREVTVRDMNRSLTGEANLLFRGNSLLTQALDCHMRRVGSDYLADVLGPTVRQINSTLPDAEVDPSRLGPDEDVKKHWATLNQLTSETWHSILASATRCPSELRLVLKYIRAVAEDRYGDFLRTVPYTSVSGFLFLRFFCPALLNPKLFGLLRDHPHPKAQRTLTLIAKSLQVLANLGSFGQKEQWMEPMNGFLLKNRQGVKNFINNVCDIPTERARMPPPPSYSTPLAILKRLPMSSKEGWLSLPYLIDDARTFAALVRFWLESTTPAEGEKDKLAAVTGDLRKFHEICLVLQKRTDECLRKAEEASSSREADPQEAEWEDILISLEESTAMDQRSFTDIELAPSTSATSIPSLPSEKHDGKAPTRAQSSGQPRMEPRVEGRQERMREQALTAADRWNSSQEPRPIPGSAGSGEPSLSGEGSFKGGKEKKERGSIWASTFGKESVRDKVPRYALGDVFSPSAAVVAPGMVAAQEMGTNNELGLDIPRMQSSDGVREKKGGFLAGLRGKYGRQDKGKEVDKNWREREGAWKEYLGGVDEEERNRVQQLRERAGVEIPVDQGERVQKRVRARKRRE